MKTSQWANVLRRALLVCLTGHGKKLPYCRNQSPPSWWVAVQWFDPHMQWNIHGTNTWNTNTHTHKYTHKSMQHTHSVCSTHTFCLSKSQTNRHASFHPHTDKALDQSNNNEGRQYLSFWGIENTLFYPFRNVMEIKNDVIRPSSHLAQQMECINPD